MAINFTINGKPYKVSIADHPIDISLNTFIREHAQLHGTKFMCLEGGCGVCICVIKGRHPASKQIQTWATNSCLTLLNVCDGWDIITVEGIGNRKDGYHPIQERLAHVNGTQCGYCSPGMVMNMYGLLEANNGKITMEEIENSFGGNICRCTGYRPILDAMKSFATDSEYEYLDLCKDIEDIGKICKKTGTLCSGSCKKSERLHAIYDDGTQWFSAKSLNDIFDIFNKIGMKKYMLAHGNTAHGVYRKPTDIEVFIDITDVPELHEYKIENDIELGGNMNLTETMNILTQASKKPGFEYCEKIVDHIDLIANVPVRNMGTLGGNLSIKHDHPEFPSDIFITFEAVAAQIVITESPSKSTTVSVLDYLKTDMTKKVLSKIILPAYSAAEYFFNSYKIMPRAQNAHAFVNAAFLVQCKIDKIISARICFGGINPEFYHATATENFLKDKDLFDNKTLSDAMAILTKELIPDWILPDASPEYRNKLACGLFYKFVLSFAPHNKVKEEYKSGGDKLKRSLSSGTQTFDTQEQNYPLTQPIPKIEALVQCSGEASYMNDLAYLPNQVWAAFVHATEANAKIVQIDPAEALKIPGVVAFFSAKDIPGINSFVDKTLLGYDEDEEIFASGDIKYFSQPLGVIVADKLNIAQMASTKVKVVYEKINYTVLPTIKDVLDAKALHRLHKVLTAPEGQAPIAVRQTKSIEGMIDLGSQYHYTMEPQTTVCIPIEDGMDIYTASQWMDLSQSAISKALNVKQNSLYLQVRRVGGAYGGKISRNVQIACACALAAMKLNRPVRFVQSIESMMSSLGKRFACHSDYKVEVDDKGKILKLENTFISDAGCTLNENPIPFLGALTATNCYQHDANWKINASAAVTDAPSHTWCRSPGSLEGIGMMENIIEHISRETGQDPVQVRLINMKPDSKLNTLLPEFVKSIDYNKRKENIEKFNKENRWRKKGLGIGVMQYPIEYFGSYSATVSIYHNDGTVSITHGGIEMGQGINTKAVQVAGHILNIPIDMIRVMPSDTVSSANSVVTGGGIGSESVCYAIKKACETLLNRLKPIRDKKKDAKWNELIQDAFLANVDLVSVESYKFGDLQVYDIWGLACSEVEIDILTGNLILSRVDILEDTGESLSPLIDIGQIEGAFIMGMGYWLSEQLVFNRQTGELLTTRTWNYKPPGAKDIPVDFRINLLQKSPNPAGFLRSKSTGEPSTCLSITVMFAVRHALESARDDAGIEEKWFHLGAPTTTEHIVLAAGNSVDKFNLI